MISRTNPMGLTITKLLLPAHWATYLINGDMEGMSAHDMGVAQSVETMYGSCTGCSDTSEFCHTHDASADGVLAGDCLTYEFMSHE